MAEPASKSVANAVVAARGARNWDGVAAIIAACVGLLALFVSGYTAYVQRQQVRAQVWPYVLVANDDPQSALGVFNKGVGPAVVRSMQVWVDGKPQRDWKHVLEAIGGSPHGFQDSTISDTVISAGEHINAIKFREDAAYQHFRSEMQKRGGMEICFCSTLDECSLYRDRVPGNKYTEDPVAQCPVVPEGDRFED